MLDTSSYISPCSMYQSFNFRVVIAAVAIAAAALMSFFGGRDDLRRIAEIRAEGIAARAEIAEAGNYRTKNSGRRWWVTLEWRDAYGAARTAERVFVSEEFARSHAQNTRVNIRYLPNHRSDEPLIEEDEAFAMHRAASTYQMGHTMIALFVLGALYLGGMFGAFRYLRRLRTE